MTCRRRKLLPALYLQGSGRADPGGKPDHRGVQGKDLSDAGLPQDGKVAALKSHFCGQMQFDERSCRARFQERLYYFSLDVTDAGGLGRSSPRLINAVTGRIRSLLSGNRPPAVSGRSLRIWARTGWSAMAAGLCWKSHWARTLSSANEINDAVGARCSPKTRSSGSTTISARRPCRT